MWRSRPLPHLTASYRGRNEELASREKGQTRRTQSTRSLSGPVDRENVSRKPTAALSSFVSIQVRQCSS